MKLGETLLPELTIVDPTAVQTATPDAINQLMSKLSRASNEASNSEKLVEEVRSATFNMVGFGPMFQALKGLPC